MSEENAEEEKVLAPAPTHTWKRVSTQVEEAQWKKVKRYALEQDLEIREVIHRALEDYFNKQDL